MQLSSYSKHRIFFEQRAAAWQLPDVHDKFFQQLKKLTSFHGDEVVLDIGCGPGSLFQFLQANIPRGRLYGIDFAFNMVKRSQEKLRSQDAAMQALAEILPIRSTTVDIIINYCLYPHLQYKLKALQEFHRVLIPGGKYYILHNQGSHEVNDVHRNIGEPVCCDFIEPLESIVARLQINGFELLKSIDQPGMIFIESQKQSE
jgi:ubiquinone/menaquinone biosynthesis C-methylase UbiE